MTVAGVAGEACTECGQLSPRYALQVCLRSGLRFFVGRHYDKWLGRARTFTLPIFPPNNLQVPVRQSRTSRGFINSDKYKMYGKLSQLCSRPANWARKWHGNQTCPAEFKLALPSNLPCRVETCPAVKLALLGLNLPC